MESKPVSEVFAKDGKEPKQNFGREDDRLHSKAVAHALRRVVRLLRRRRRVEVLLQAQLVRARTCRQQQDFTSGVLATEPPRSGSDCGLAVDGLGGSVLSVSLAPWKNATQMPGISLQLT